MSPWVRKGEETGSRVGSSVSVRTNKILNLRAGATSCFCRYKDMSKWRLGVSVCAASVAANVATGSVKEITY